VNNLVPADRPLRLLHADLYRENIPFDRSGNPVFIDPLPMMGDPAFDWAFFTVYYDLARDPVRRLELASRYSSIPIVGLLPWCLLLCFDGLLYYHDVGDMREPRMVEVLSAIATEGVPR